MRCEEKSESRKHPWTNFFLRYNNKKRSKIHFTIHLLSRCNTQTLHFDFLSSPPKLPSPTSTFLITLLTFPFLPHCVFLLSPNKEEKKVKQKFSANFHTCLSPCCSPRESELFFQLVEIVACCFIASHRHALAGPLDVCEKLQSFINKWNQRGERREPTTTDGSFFRFFFAIKLLNCTTSTPPKIYVNGRRM